MKSVFNEKRYLNADQEALEVIEELRKERLQELLEANEKYYETIIKYDLFLDELVDELEKYNLTNSLEYSIALNYLLDNGWLSDNGIFKHKESNSEIVSKLGINIVSGSGCCRNISDFHKDVFDKLKRESILFYCYQGFFGGSNKHANHVINLVEYNDNIYGIDLHNHSIIYHFKKPLVMDMISLFNKDKLIYKPYYGLITGENDLESINENIKRFEECSKKKPITAIEYDNDIKHQIKSMMKSNKSSYEKFHNKTKVLKKEIAQTIYNL